ncbi:MAG: hypothetical protein JXQ23_00985 [Clostridia bacterium]|nr:hypothetical protein [Clostridia bacterium]
MNNILNLFKISFLMGFRGDISKKRKFQKPVLIALLSLSFLPLIVSVVLLSKELYIILDGIGQGNIIVALSIASGSLVVLVFGMFYTISAYYLAKDITNYLSLPLKPEEIIASRFLTTLIYEYLTLFVFVVPVIIGCGIGGSFGIFYYLISLVVFLLLPILPLSVASVIIVIIMSFSRRAVNKDRFSLLSGILGLGIGLGINFSLQSVFSKIDDTAAIEDLIAQGKFDMLGQVSSYFPGIKNATLAIVNHDILQLLIFIVIAIVSFMIFLFIAKKLYFKGVLGINQQSAKKEYKLSETTYEKSRNTIMAYTIKELKLIFRTPIYFMNLALMDYLMPLIFVFAFASTGELGPILESVRTLVTNSSFHGLILVITFAIFMFISSMNGITATCISREGDQLYIMKYLPMTIKDQVNAKLLSGLVVSFVGMFIVVLMIVIFLKISLLISILMFLVGINAVLLTRLTGLYIDLSKPKLKWDNEVKAVKQNMNLVLNMFIGLTMAGLFTFLGFWLHVSLFFAICIYILAFGILNFILIRFINNKANSLIMRIE